MLGIADLGGGGGTERYFADIFAAYDRAVPGKFDLWLIADKRSIERLTATGRQIAGERVLPFDDSITSLRGIRALCRLCRNARIRLLHMPLESRK